MIRPASSLLVLLAFAAMAHAQHEAHPGGHPDHHSVYATQERTEIAALSRREMNDLLAGAGMGLARSAELNQYPGPLHVLELADDLGLDQAQRTAVEKIRRDMLEEAKRLGHEIVEAERHLDRRFAHRHIDEEVLRRSTDSIARLLGALRFVHLRAHLETRELLSGDQVEDYDRLRGYSEPEDES